MPPPPCTSCHVACIRTLEEFYVKCSECKRCWHDGCLYQRMSSDEIQERNRLLSHGTVNGSWLDWTCRRCRKEGEEGREHRPVKELDVHDLTVDSDDDASSEPKPKPGLSAGSLSTTAPRPTPATGRNRRVPMKSAPIPKKFRPPPPQVTPLPTKQTENRPASVRVPPTAAPKPTPAPTLSRRVPMKSATLASQNPYAPHAKAKLPSSKLPHDKEVVDLVSSDDEIQIVDPPDKPRHSTRPPETREPPTPNKGDQPTIDAQDQPIPDTQEPPTLDIRDLSLEESVHDPPLPEFPSSEPTPFEHRLGPTVAAPRPAPVLPPALRPSTRSILGQRLIGATERDRIVQMIGLGALKSGRWKLESRIRESVSLEPNPPRTGPDKGKGRAVGERTRDWTPLLQQEQARERQAQQLRLQVPRAMYLVPPNPPTINPTLMQNVHPPRKPRKAMTVVHRDDTVKLEPVEFALS